MLTCLSDNFDVHFNVRRLAASMTNGNSPPTSSSAPEALKLFNEFQSQSRARAEATLKLILVVSGGMLTLSVGAVLGNSPPNIPAHLLPALTWGWGLLFYSIATSLVLLFSMIIATFHMGVLWREKLEGQKESFVFVATWSWLRVLNGIIGVSVLLSCVAGIALMAHVALGVVATLGAVQPTGISNGTAPTSKATNTLNPTVEKDTRKSSARPSQ